MSQGRVMVRPAPMETPLMAAMIGFERATNETQFSRRSRMRMASPLSSARWMPLSQPWMLAPAQKPLPAPVRTIAPIPGSLL